MWYVYILKCEDGSLYTGITDDFSRRFKEHIQGKGGHYTSFNRPREVLYKESFENRLNAEHREQQIKCWSKAKKLALINGDSLKLKELAKSND